MNCKLMKILNDIILVLLEFVLNMIKLVIQTTGFYNLTFKFYSRSSALIALALLVNYLITLFLQIFKTRSHPNRKS